MREMLEITERLTALRNGRKVAEGPMRDFDKAAITRAMTGHELAETPLRPAIPPDRAPLLEVAGLSVPVAVHGVDLATRPGEIVGLSGLIGSGRTELARARRARSGRARRTPRAVVVGQRRREGRRMAFGKAGFAEFLDPAARPREAAIARQGNQIETIRRAIMARLPEACQIHAS